MCFTLKKKKSSVNPAQRGCANVQIWSLRVYPKLEYIAKLFFTKAVESFANSNIQMDCIFLNPKTI